MQIYEIIKYMSIVCTLKRITFNINNVKQAPKRLLKDSNKCLFLTI